MAGRKKVYVRTLAIQQESFDLDLLEHTSPLHTNYNIIQVDTT